MSIKGITTSSKDWNQYPNSGPAATTPKTREVWAAASVNLADIPLQNFDIASLQLSDSLVAAMTGVGGNVNISI